MLDSIQSYLPELAFIIPELILASGVLVLLISDLLISEKYRYILFGLATLIVISSLFVLLSKPASVDPVLFKALFPNQASVFFRVLADLTMLMVLIFWFFSKKGKDYEVNTEYPFLYLAVLFAAHILCISNSWISVFLSIEFLSVASYILVGIAHEKRNTEAAFKYLIFGAMSTGIMLFGISLLLAAKGNVYFSGFEFIYADAFTGPDLLSIGLVIAFAGIFFKLSLFPFHFWVPDVYQGSSLPLMSMISTLPKIAAFGFFVSQFLFIWPQQVFMSGNLSVVLASLGIISLTWGNLAALQQKNFSRLMAYSGIAQVGFMMLALVNGYRDVFNLEIFLSLYVFMNLAVFISAESIKKEAFNIGIDDFSGLGKSASHQQEGLPQNL